MYPKTIIEEDMFFRNVNFEKKILNQFTKLINQYFQFGIYFTPKAAGNVQN